VKDVPNFRAWQLEDENQEKMQYLDLFKRQRDTILKNKVKEYGTKVYRKATITIEEDRKDVICQRENGFYVDTVRDFRDRRYTYKGLLRKWKGNFKEAEGEIAKKNAKKKVTLYDSLQLAHKCILNSFYGYVMRKGARWYSMPMAAITTHVGGTIIKDAHLLCARIGRPLELDTDGIWTLLPGTFPEEYDLKTKPGKSKKGKITLEYPGSMLNLRTARKYTNDKWQELADPEKKIYMKKKECSIFFEVDGPYLAMILPASTEEGKKLKKRYAVYERDGSLAELKGFEIKRRGELEIIKQFQGEIFKTFLKGEGLQGIYNEVGKVAARFLDILDTKGSTITDHQLFELITENRNMSKPLEEYGNGRSTSITCAKRLAEFLGDEVLEGGGLKTSFIVSAKPVGASVSDRAIPVKIFSAEPPIMKQFVRKWTKDNSLSGAEFDIRNILDWPYYRKRFGSNIQKIVTIPAAMQGITNPVPNLIHPTWLAKHLRERNDPFKQRSIKSFFQKQVKAQFAVDDRPASEREKAQKQLSLNMSHDDSLANSMSGSIESPSQSLDLAKELGLKRRSQASSLPAIPEEEEEEIEQLHALPKGADKDAAAAWAAKAAAGFKLLNAKRRKRKAAERVEIRPSKRHKKGGKGAQPHPEVKFANKKLKTLYQNPWHILQIAPGHQAGNFTIWAIIDGQLRNLSLNIKRRFYINTEPGKSGELLQAGGKKVNRTLPRGRRPGDLIEFSMSETQFQEREQQLKLFMTKAWVEGVYEMHVSHEFRACVDIGCVARVADRHRRKEEHLTSGFQLEELEFVAHGKLPYLPDPIWENLDKAFFYHTKATNGRSIVAFVHRNHDDGPANLDDDEDMEDRKEDLDEEPDAWEAHLIMVNPHGGQKEAPVDLIQHAREWIRESIEQEGEEAAEKYWEPNVSSAVTHVKSLAQAYRDMRRVLENYSSSVSRKCPALVVSMSSLDLDELYRVLPPLREDFPTIQIDCEPIDLEYPPLQWQAFVSNCFIERFVEVPSNLNQLREFATFIHAPLGNIPNEDIGTFGMDLFFARTLSDRKHLLWVSPGERPDLGGAEEDENLFDEEHTNPREVFPGMHHTICVEMSLGMLPVNAVLMSARVTDDEVIKTTKEVEEDQSVVKSKYVFDDSCSCLGAFRVLKDLIQNLITEAGRGGEDTIAEHLLRNFYRWLYSTKSYLHDPLLFKYVHLLMKKIHVQLLTEIQNLTGGREKKCPIVYSCFDKVIINTEKTTIVQAGAFMRNCMTTLNMGDGSRGAESLFKWIEFDITKTWGCLAFLDPRNYAGYEILMDDEGGVFEEQLRVEMNIGKYLPKLTQEKFKVMVGEFVDVNHKEFKLRIEEQEQSSDRPTQALMSTKEMLKKFLQWRRQQLETFFAPKLYGTVDEIFKKLPPNSRCKDTQSSHFPLLAGSHLPLNNPALEFCKYLLRVYELDHELIDDVYIDDEAERSEFFTIHKLRQNAFRLCGTRVFQPNTEFQDPCSTVVIPDVVCTHCQTARDVDICRDNSDPYFVCSNCDFPRNKDDLESRLVEMIIRKNTSYQVQDLKCKRCSIEKAATMNRLCRCSGAFMNKVEPGEIIIEIRKFHNMACFHNFAWLKETTELMASASRLPGGGLSLVHGQMEADAMSDDSD